MVFVKLIQVIAAYARQWLIICKEKRQANIWLKIFESFNDDHTHIY